MFIHGMRGLGDNLFQRPFVRSAATRHPTVYLETPWPELYEDLPNVRPVRTFTTLRTQARNERRSAAVFTAPPGPMLKARFTYGHRDLLKRSILQSLELGVALNAGEALSLDLPPGCMVEPAGFATLAPYVVVRPATVRTEWSNPARNPRPEYLVAAAAAAQREGFRVVVVADLKPGEEDLVGELPAGDVYLCNGELETRELLGLVANAAGVIGGVGWIVPAAIAARRPALIVLGGNGDHNAPSKITDPRLDLSRMQFARPDNFCMCNGKGHQCDKSITTFPSTLATWIAGLRETRSSSPSSPPA